ncbi:MAG: hypothetical protein HC897_08735 [Thermoanaerobaculia bacterium]|nr:hypothetical protein [Thermoanaerobaculia bacterium]
MTINLNDTDPAQAQATDTLPNSFTYVSSQIPVPEPVSVTPASGPNEGGTRVTIRGTGFSNQVQVFFGRPTSLVEAQLTNISATKLEAITPAATGVNSANANSIVNVQVINLDSGFTGTLTNAFQYGNANAPNIQISAIDPNLGPLEGGNQVRVFGQGFDDPVSVSLAGVLADVRSVSGSEIVVRAGVPPRSNGCTSVTGPVTVTNIETNETASGPSYTYEAITPQILSISPISSQRPGGAPMTIRGIDLPTPDNIEDILVIFGNTEGTVTNYSDQQITVTIPPFTGVFPTIDCDDNGDGINGEQAVAVLVGIRVVDRQNGCNATLANSFAYEPTPDEAACQEPPAPSFTATQVTGTTRVRFTNTTPNISENTYQWSFGDGFGSSQQTPPEHDYTGAMVGDEFTIVLRATKIDTTLTGTAQQTVTIE